MDKETVYSLGIGNPDSTGYDFLTLTQVDSVLSGYKPYDEKHKK